MSRTGKKVFLFSITFMCVLMVTIGMSGSVLCSAANQESFPESTAPEKTLTILKDVVGLHTAIYSTNLDLHNQDLYFEVLPQENVKYTLESDESKLEVICTFVNDKLRSMNTYMLDGSPRMTQQATSILEMAKDFIDRYQAYSGVSYYGALRSMLDDVEANKNVTKTSENVKLEVTVDENSASFRWTYTVNGVEASSKCVALYFEQGFLKHFIDTWSLYRIGSANINLSKEEAVKIAMDRAKNYSWRVGVGGDDWIEVTEFNIVGVSQTILDFGNYISKGEARGGDPLTLYPGWHIKLYFDKLYPGNVYGIDVGIWADTGEVHDIRTLLLLGDYSSNGDANGNEDSIVQESSESNNETDPNMTQIGWIVLPISIAIALGATKGYYRRKKRSPHELHNVPKSNSLKLGGALYLLISLTIFSMVMPTVKAGTYVMGLYGSRWNMTTQEQNAAKAVIDSMEYWFGNYAGYTCYDLYGSLTQKQTVLDHASAFEQYFDHVAMFHHGHGGMSMAYPQYHRDYFDDDGPNPLSNQIWDHEVGLKTWRSKHFFVILWACRQGDHEGGRYGPLGAYGMPYAWHNPVSSGDCFIGFKDASMPLTQTSIHYPYPPYSSWLVYFIFYLTYHHYTIMQALDYASIVCLNRPYYSTELHTKFTAYWPGMPSGEGWMKIYGNPNIRVY